MTREEVEQHYPGAVDAVLVHENAGEASVVLDHIWWVAVAFNVPPTKVRDILVRNATDTVKVIPDGPLSKNDVIPQMSSPDFLRFVAGKLGAM